MSQTIQIPISYLRCTAEDGKCPIRETCLRSKVHREADYKSERGNRGLWTVNLWNDAIKPLSSQCEMYRNAETRQFAQGFSHLFDLVPKGIYAEVREQVEHVFTNRIFFFQCKKGTRLTSPEEQQKIAKIFRNNGIASPPNYDAMVDVYDYSE